MSNVAMTKKQLLDENTELQNKVQEQESYQKELDERIERMEALIRNQPAETPGQTTSEPEVHNFYDPYDASQNPLKIKKHPDGFHLSWKNPNLRDGGGKGWEGWEPVTWDSEIGKHLANFLDAPPKRFAGSAEQDNYIRRGSDAILCKLPVEWWLARQQKRSRKAMRNQAAASNVQNRTIMPGVSTFGDGVQQEISSTDNPSGSTLGPNEHLVGRTQMFHKQE